VRHPGDPSRPRRSRNNAGVDDDTESGEVRIVVARATRPAVLVRAGEASADELLPVDDNSAGGQTGYRDVVSAVDLDVPGDAEIEFAFEADRLRGARLRVVHV
jgi:hypothetical protein